MAGSNNEVLIPQFNHRDYDSLARFKSLLDACKTDSVLAGEKDSYWIIEVGDVQKALVFKNIVEREIEDILEYESFVNWIVPTFVSQNVYHSGFTAMQVQNITINIGSITIDAIEEFTVTPNSDIMQTIAGWEVDGEYFFAEEP